ncbi:Fungal specific transcription factor domain [Ceratobasidium sp. AG-Ba]|nr:Fungal specific transcription factor domain [Ceratobasidium sp. AG-Ba]
MFIPADGAADALKFANLATSEQEIDATVNELDLGMEDWVPLVSLADEHKLLDQFWDWQRMHLRYVAPVPFLSAYAIHSEAAHAYESVPPLSPPFSAPSTIAVPRPAAVKPSIDLFQFISPLLLDSMFAIAALFTGDPETSEKFYSRAKTRVLSEVANPRLATVQAMIIMATWELGHARGPITWILSGMTCALCVRLGMNTDATPLVSRGVMSERLFQTRNFVFWSTYIMDRTIAAFMGMHPLIDKRAINTPDHWSFATANGAGSSEPPNLSDSSALSGSFGAEMGAEITAPDASIDWLNPTTLGIGDVVIQALWESIRDLNLMADALFDEIYSLDAAERTPQEDLELVTRNNLTVQRFLDNLPTWLRSTAALRKKENNLVYLHMFVHSVNIIASRPFLSPRSLSEAARRIDARTHPTEPTHSSHIIRRYRTLAFRASRASALQIMSLVRHIPLSSPCVTLPYLVYTASTVLLLAPDDPVAMDGVNTGISCLECMDGTGYWVTSARNARERIYALASRWGVKIVPKNKPLGHMENRINAGSVNGHHISGEIKETGPTSRYHHTPSQNGRARLGRHVGVSNGINSGSLFDQPSYQPGDDLDYVSSYPCIGGTNQAPIESQETICFNKSIIGEIGHCNTAILTPMDPPHSRVLADGGTYIGHTGAQVRPKTQAMGHELDKRQNPVYSELKHCAQREQPNQPTDHSVQSYMHLYSEFYYQENPFATLYRPNRLPHVAYARSHADPRHDLQVEYNHLHEAPPSLNTYPHFPDDTDPCEDISAYFLENLGAGGEPSFVQTTTDPFADLGLDRLTDPQLILTPVMLYLN